MKKHFVLLVLAAVLTCGMLTGVTSSKYTTEASAGNVALLVKKQLEITMDGHSHTPTGNTNPTYLPTITHNSSGTIAVTMSPESGTNDRVNLYLKAPEPGDYQLTFDVTTLTNGGATDLISNKVDSTHEYTFACIVNGAGNLSSFATDTGAWMQPEFGFISRGNKRVTSSNGTYHTHENTWRAATMMDANGNAITHHVTLKFTVGSDMKITWVWNWSDIPDSKSTTMTLSNIKLEKIH